MKYAAYLAAPRAPGLRAIDPIDTDARTLPFASNVHTMQPDAAFSEYTMPFWLPTNNRPPATVGCAHADVASWKPKAHFRCSLGTCSGVSPASATD